MAEFLEGISSLNDVVSRANETTAIIGTEALEQSGFIDNIRQLGLDPTVFKVGGESGEIKVFNGDTPLNLEEAANQMNNFGNLEGGLREMGLSDEVLNQDVIKNFSKRYKVAWDNLQGNKDISIVKTTEEIGQNLADELGDPQNPDELENALNKSNFKENFLKESESVVDRMKRNIKEGKKTTVGKWIKRGLAFGTGVAIISEIFFQIKQHQHAINGCWLVNKKTGSKCKVKSLSCGTSGGNNNNLYCLPNTCGHSGACFPTNTCIKYNGNRCMTRLGKCNSGTCGRYCDNKYLSVPRGHKLVCVHVNFWGSASDMIESALIPDGVKWWLWIIAIIVLVVVVIIVFK